MSATGWMPVDETASKWTPVAEPTKTAPAEPYSAVTEGAQPFIGAAKGLGSTVYGASNLVNKGIRAVGHGVGLGDVTDKYVPPFPAQKPDYLAPQTTGQKIGYGAEQAGEFAIPSGAVSKAGKAIDAGVDAYRAVPFISSALKLGGKAALEGASTGAVTAAQGGDVGTNAAIGAATPVVAAAMKPIGSYLASKAPSVANKILRPVPTQIEKAAKYGRNPGQAIADEGIVATSLPDMLDKVSNKKEEVGQQIHDLLATPQNAAKQINAKTLIEKPINDMVQKVVDGKVDGGQGLIDQLEEMRNTLTNQRQLVNGKLEVTAPKNLSLSLPDAHALKRQVGDMTGWTGQAFDDQLNQVRRGIYRNLNNEIQSQADGVGGLQSRYGNLLEAETAAKRETARHEARNPFGLLDAGMGGAAALAGALHGGMGDRNGSGLGEAALFGAGMVAGRHAVQSPLARSLEVQMLKNSSKAFSPAAIRGARNAFFGASNTSQTDQN